MLRRNGEMNTHAACCGGVLRPLDQMLLCRLARPFRIGMERHQSLGAASVAEPFDDDVLDCGAVVGSGGQCSAQLGPEGEPFEVLQQQVDSFAALSLLDEGEQLLEHTRCGARRGDELDDAEPCRRFVVAPHGGRQLLRRGGEDSVARRCGADDFQVGKAAAEVFELPLHRLGGESVRPDAGCILFGKHRRFRF